MRRMVPELSHVPAIGDGLLFQERQYFYEPGHPLVAMVSGRNVFVHVFETMKRQGNLFQVIAALDPSSRFPRRLDRRQQDRDQNRDDRNHD